LDEVVRFRRLILIRFQDGHNSGKIFVVSIAMQSYRLAMDYQSRLERHRALVSADIAV
jgi:hypothetical protein